MAVTKITPAKMLVADNFAGIDFVAATAQADGFMVDFTERDDKTVLVFQNTGASEATVTIKAGNGIQGVADLVSAEIPANAYHAVVINSGEHKIVKGENKGYVHAIPSATTLKLGAIVLP